MLWGDSCRQWWKVAKFHINFWKHVADVQIVMFRPHFLLCLWHARGAVRQQFLTVVWNYQEYEPIPSLLNSKGLLKSQWCHTCDCSAASALCGAESMWTFADQLPSRAAGQEFQQVAMGICIHLRIWYCLQYTFCTKCVTKYSMTCLFQNSLPVFPFLGQCNASRLCLGGLLEEPSTLFHPFLSFPFARCLEAKAPGSNPKESLDLGHPAAGLEIL